MKCVRRPNIPSEIIDGLKTNVELLLCFIASAELNNFPLFAKFGTYSGGSYSVSIGPTKKVAKKIVRNMKDHFWIDRFTRAIILEANIYNANTNLMLMVTFAHEILATGGWEYFSNVKAIRLYRYVGGVPNLILLFDFIFVFVTFVGLYKMIRGIKRNGCANYLSDFWNLLHTIVTCSALGAICLTFGRLFAVKSAVYTYSQEPEKFVSFSMVDQMENFVMAFLGFVLFFTNLEYLRIMRFNKSIANMTKTMKILGTPLMSFGMTFIIIFMAYVSFCHCIFADKLRDFNSVKTSFVALTNMFMGSFDIYAYLDNAPIFGPIMFFSYMLAIQMIMINMFVGIICDAFAEVGEQEDNEEKPSVLSFMANRVKSLAAPKGAMSKWRFILLFLIISFYKGLDHPSFTPTLLLRLLFRPTLFLLPNACDYICVVAILYCFLFTLQPPPVWIRYTVTGKTNGM